MSGLQFEKKRQLSHIERNVDPRPSDQRKTSGETRRPTARIFFYSLKPAAYRLNQSKPAPKVSSSSSLWDETVAQSWPFLRAAVR